MSDMNYITAPDIGGLFVGLAMLILVIFIASHYFPGQSKTRRYRQQMVDLYVVGKVRQLAEKDKIDLKEELRLFLEDRKERKKYFQDLDEVIEDEMKDEIIDSKVKKKETKKE